jgi:TRAP-type C4-dicarboxylate transport system permease small subunit
MKTDSEVMRLKQPDDSAEIDSVAGYFEEESEPVDLSHHSIEDWVALCLFVTMGFCVLLQFVSRYIFNNSFTWTEEIASIALVLVVFIGSISCIRLDRHIQIDQFHNLLPEHYARWMRLVALTVIIATLGYVCWIMFRYLNVVGRERLITVNIPKWPFYYVIASACVMMFIRALLRTKQDFTVNPNGQAEK